MIDWLNGLFDKKESCKPLSDKYVVISIMSAPAFLALLAMLSTIIEMSIGANDVSKTPLVLSTNEILILLPPTNCETILST